MWLIDTSTLVLEHVTKPNDDKYAYAILSHTWGDSELSYEEWRAGTGKEKEGYEKIIQTCKQARQDGYNYAWVDTVCINKENSAELSEAINSMWQWFCNAKVCYAYLSDIDTAEVCQPELYGPSDEEWLDGSDDEVKDPNTCISLKTEATGPRRRFGSSRWFQRGWTLQELLASRKIRFYSRNWDYIGVKAQLVETISEMTGIDELALKDSRSLPHFTIAKRMSWAASRETSRPADRAYSLLGMFGVKLPLLYGEGDQAFVRLQEELLRTSMDHSLFAWTEMYPSWNPRSRTSGSSSEGRVDMLFAKSPLDFRDGRTIVRWDAGWISAPYYLTHKGLHFDSIPLV